LNKIIVIVGPTAVGKTKLSVKLAQIFNGEIINADSMQVYKGLDIGTAKVKPEEKNGIKHHLFDIVEVNDMYTVFDYQKDARAKIDEVIKKGRIPILVGGSGLYIKAALYNYEFSLEDKNQNSSFDDISNEELYNLIKKYDEKIEIDINNRKRLVRTLNKVSQGVLSSYDGDKILYDAIFIGLTTNRDILYERINKRVDEMLIDLVDEVKYFHQKGIRSKALDTGIGYKELYDFFDNKVSFKEAIGNVKQNSRNYAKRQYTWFNNEMNVNWFNVDFSDFDKTVDEVVSFIENNR